MNWLVLTYSLPSGPNSSPRVALWRRLKRRGLLLSLGWLSAPFFLGGALKIGYDLTLYAGFRALRPPEEQHGSLMTGKRIR